MTLRTMGLGLVGLMFALPAAAVPGHFGHQGRIRGEDGQVLSGEHTLSFTLYGDADGTTALWSQSYDVVLASGYYHVNLGADPANPFPEDLLASGGLWLTLAVDGDESEDPPVSIASVPFALSATTSQNLTGGTVDASVIKVNGRTVVDEDGVYRGQIDGGLDQLQCFADQFAMHDGIQWTCGDDAIRDAFDVVAALAGDPVDLHPQSTIGGIGISAEDHTHRIPWEQLDDRPAGLDDGDDDLLGDLRCRAGDYVSLLEGEWTCRRPEISTGADLTEWLAGHPIELSPDTQVAWSQLTGVPPTLLDGDSDSWASFRCATGESPRWSGTAWQCARETIETGDDVVDYLVNNPIDLTGGTVLPWDQITNRPAGLDDGDNDLWAQTSCPPGRNLRYKADNSGWECVREPIETGSDVASYLAANAVTLHPATTIGGINLADRIIPPGMIAMFASACPTGWSEYTALRGRFPRGEAAGSATSLDAGGTDDAVVVAHGHSVSGTAADAGAHSHTYSATTGDQSQSHNHGINLTSSVTSGAHSHGFSATTGGQSADHTHGVSGSTANGGVDHTHGYSGSTSSAGADHSHGFSTNNAGSHGHGVSDPGHRHPVYTHNDDANCSGGSPAGIHPCGDHGYGHVYDMWAETVGTNISINGAGDHSHSGTTATANANHSHSFSGTSGSASAVNHAHNVSLTSGGTSSNHSHDVSGTTASAGGDHSHSVSGTSANASQGHTHDVSGTVSNQAAHGHAVSGTAANTGVTGVGQNLPRYQEVLFCVKNASR